VYLRATMHLDTRRLGICGKQAGPFAMAFCLTGNVSSEALAPPAMTTRDRPCTSGSGLLALL
jgi:hypothetical protein